MKLENHAEYKSGCKNKYEGGMTEHCWKICMQVSKGLEKKKTNVLVIQQTETC